MRADRSLVGSSANLGIGARLAFGSASHESDSGARLAFGSASHESDSGARLAFGSASHFHAGAIGSVGEDSEGAVTEAPAED
jgi:hypothetical protein